MYSHNYIIQVLMKKLILFLIFTLSILSFSEEKIVSYSSYIYVNKDGTIDVLDKIYYITDEDNKHGIIRFIPYKNNGSYLKRENKISIINMEIFDENNNKLNYEKYKNSYITRYKIGNPDVFLEPLSVNSYFFKYKLVNVLRKKDNVVQLYLNAIGNYWEFPIEKAEIIITGIDGDIEIYTGKYGEAKNNFNITKIDNGFKIETKNLDSYEGLTVRINSETFNYSNISILKNQFYTYMFLFLLPIILLIVITFFIANIYYKLKYKDKKPIMVEYFIDEKKITPYFSAYVIKSYNKYILIAIFNLLNKNLVEFKNDKYILKENLDNIELSHEESLLYKLIPKKYYNDLLNINNTKNLMNLDFKINSNEKSKYLKNSKKSKITFLTIISILITLLLTLSILNDFIEIIMYLIIVAFSILTIYISSSINIETEDLKDDIRKIKGFKKYLTSVEEKEIKKYNNPDDLIKYFKSILPYVVAFNLENKYIHLLNKIISENDFDKNFISDIILLDHMFRLNNTYSKNISYYKKTDFKNNNNGGFSSGSGFSGGGFSGGGGSSW